jgi:hypothetical protein
MRLSKRYTLGHLLTLLAILAAGGCGRPHVGSGSVVDSGAVARAELPAARADGPRQPGPPGPAGDSIDPRSYEGHDSRGIPHYATRTFSPEEARLLRAAYGVEDPRRLYVSDSTEEGVLKYDTEVKRCLTCYVNSYGVGFVSVRRPGESWEQVEHRVKAAPAHEFASAAIPSSESIAALDPDVRPLAEQMLAAARAAGFRVRVVGTYRSPRREAFLMSLGGGRTHTLTSMHSYGRALDVVVDDGVLAHARTKADWIAFRRWVPRYTTATGQPFRILGSADRTWDWPHVEVPSDSIGFGTIEEALSRARRCLAPNASVPCTFPPHLPTPLASSATPSR